jgi:hypothetical protein
MHATTIGLHDAVQALSQFDEVARVVLSAVARAGPLNTSPAAFLALLDHKPLPQGATSSSILHANYYKQPPAPPAAAAVKERPKRGRAAAAATSSTGHSRIGSSAAPTAAGQSGGSIAELLHGAQAHHDRGLLTFVNSSSSDGLEVQEAGSGSWQPLVLGPDQLLVMVGYSLTVATAGALPTCMHRVVSGRDGLGTCNVCCCRVCVSCHELPHKRMRTT